MSGKLGILVIGILLGSMLTHYLEIEPLLNTLTGKVVVLSTGSTPSSALSDVTGSSSSSILNATAAAPVLCQPRPEESSAKSAASLVENTPISTKAPLVTSTTTLSPKPDETTETTAGATESMPSHPWASEKRPGFCRHVPPGVTATMLWKSQRDRIVKATRNDIAGKELKDLQYPPWLEGLFSLLHTRFLRKGYTQAPLPSAMKQVLQIVDAAMQKKGRPLSVVVMGGSVTYGRGSCYDPFKKHAVKSNSIKCSWPLVLQRLVDDFLGPNVVRIENLAVGGTSTALSTTIVKYKLYPENIGSLKKYDPDIIINAYSTNDSLPPSGNATYDMEYQLEKREMAQKFIQACQASRPCDDLPLVMYVDDYVGNQHNLILGENTNGWKTQEITEWYGAMFVSYATAVRRIVYANQQETLLSGYWPWWSGRSDPPRIQVHFPLSAHIALSWVVGYAVLSSIVEFCDDAYSDAHVAKQFPDFYPQIIMDMVERVAPPPLNADTKIETISADWLEKTKTDVVTRDKMCGKRHLNETLREQPCDIAFICGPVGTVRSARSLQQFTKYFVTEDVGWKVDNQVKDGGWKNKLGYVAVAQNATTTFYKAKTTNDVRALKLYYLKSYGEKWEGSRARFTLRGLKNQEKVLEKTFTLDAWHNSNTSIAYQHELDLGKEALSAGVRVELTAQLISGASFKIIGLVICSRP
jgi:hypothetical protein